MRVCLVWALACSPVDGDVEKVEGALRTSLVPEGDDAGAASGAARGVDGAWRGVPPTRSAATPSRCRTPLCPPRDDGWRRRGCGGAGVAQEAPANCPPLRIPQRIHHGRGRLAPGRWRTSQFVVGRGQRDRPRGLTPAQGHEQCVRAAGGGGDAVPGSPPPPCPAVKGLLPRSKRLFAARALLAMCTPRWVACACRRPPSVGLTLARSPAGSAAASLRVTCTSTRRLHKGTRCPRRRGWASSTTLCCLWSAAAATRNTTTSWSTLCVLCPWPAPPPRLTAYTQAVKAGKNVTYATTEMVSPRAFVDQLAALGKA